MVKETNNTKKRQIKDRLTFPSQVTAKIKKLKPIKARETTAYKRAFGSYNKTKPRRGEEERKEEERRKGESGEEDRHVGVRRRKQKNEGKNGEKRDKKNCEGDKGKRACKDRMRDKMHSGLKRK